MAGHSKWANIKIRKGAQDAKRGKIFTKLIREITTAARLGGGDLAANARLRGAVLAARAQNMPKETTERAIKRGAGGLDGANYEEARYEGYGPGGVAVIVQTLTDNYNRTVADVRHAFTKFAGNLGTAGCVSYLFDNKGELIFENCDEDALIEAALEAGAEDVVSDGTTFEVITAPDQLHAVQEVLAQAGFNPIRAELIMRPQNSVTLDEKQASSMLKMMDMLEDNDDVQKVYANFDIPDEILERLANG
ncbi:MAG: YebC/PmpR family DNA-binding transcriptional regulator [Magnetococcales bacterium]|nr:YebC/PmpR family DNA-binding transcriptional regulator [Magnetococcales bacterium]